MVSASSNTARGTSRNDSAVPMGLAAEVSDSLPALKCRAILFASLTGRTSDDLMMVHRTNLGRLRVLRRTFCSGLETTFDHFDKHPEPDMKRPKLPFSADGPLPCPEIARLMHFADALRTNYNGQTPEGDRHLCRPWPGLSNCWHALPRAALRLPGAPVSGPFGYAIVPAAQSKLTQPVIVQHVAAHQVVIRAMSHNRRGEPADVITSSTKGGTSRLCGGLRPGRRRLGAAPCPWDKQGICLPTWERISF